MLRTRLFRATLLALACTASLAVAAQADVAKSLDIPGGDLVAALSALAKQSGVELIYRADQLRGVRTKGVKGTLTAQDALAQLLKDSGFAMRRDASGAIVIVRGTNAAPPRPSGRGASKSADAGSEDKGKNRELETVVVVGSRLAAASPGESIVPVKMITREEIERSGASSIAQVLSYLPEVSVNNVGDTNIGVSAVTAGGTNGINATTVQLRGLPAGTTLVLINGRRAGESSAFVISGQFDLSSIPLSMVERIEVLPAGASAVYGGDGLGGVVNIVLRRGVSGLEARVRYASADGYDERIGSLFWGRTWSRGDLTASLTWRDNTRLTSAERSLTADKDYRRFGGYDYRTSVSNPGNVYSLAGCPSPPNYCFMPLDGRGNLPGLNSPFAAVPGGQDGTGLTPADFVAGAGQLNKSSAEEAFFSPETTYSLAVNGNFHITETTEFFSELAYTRRDIPAQELAFGQSVGYWQVPSAVMPASNPFNPFGVDVGVEYRFDHTGLFRDFSQTYERATFGLRGQWRRWEWEVAGWASRDRSNLIGASGFDLEKFAAALASTDPATALNPLVGDGSAPASPEVMRSLLGDSTASVVGSDQRGFNGFIRGPLFSLPAGEVTGLVGAEYQKLSVLLNPDSDYPIGGDDVSRAVFGEFRVPIWKSRGDDGLERMAFTGAFRRERSGRFDQDANSETLGLQFRPHENLMFRATYSTAFRPLVVFTAVQPSNSFPVPISDPHFGGAYVFPQYVIGGGVPEGLLPETSTSRTIGFVYTPAADWRLSVTRWDNRLRNRLTTVFGQYLVDNEESFPTRVVRDPNTGVLVKVDARPINISATEMAGMDFSVDGLWHTRFGDFLPSLSATRTFKYREQVTPVTPVQDNLAVRRDTGWAPRWKIVPRLGWDYNSRFYTTLTGRYVSSYQDPEPLASGPHAGDLQTLGNFWLVDLNFDIDIGPWLTPVWSRLSETRLNVGVNNLTNRLPNFCNSCGSAGYDASQYDIRGRYVYAELRVDL